MKIDSKILIEKQDWNYVLSHDINEIFDLLTDFQKKYKHPLILDKYQLSHYIGGISFKRLFELVNNTESYYTDILMKKWDTSVRIINAPDRLLKSVQCNINREILQYYPVSEYAVAYIKGKSIIANAVPHQGKKYLLKTDLEDFFGHITSEMVYKQVFNRKHFPNANIGKWLTELCCYKGHLPQGAPTSPTISNIVMLSFDNIIGKWCKERNISYTRYSDDLTFSSDKPLYVTYVKAKSILHEFGFEINERKTHFITNGSRQEVTGIVVNEGLNVPKDYRRKLRQQVYYTLKYGPKSCLYREIKENFERSYGRKPEEDDIEFELFKNNRLDDFEVYRFLISLIGQVDWVLQVNPDSKYFREAKEKLRYISHYNRYLKDCN